MLISGALLFALVLDYYLGEPKKYHPLVGFGKFASFIHKTLSSFEVKSTSKKVFIGILAWFCAVLPFVGLSFYLSHYFSTVSVVADILFQAVVVYICIGATSLKQHAMDVYQQLKAEDLGAARIKTSYIVSRETRDMEELDVRKATIESVLENGSDAIFAPIFWFVLLGVPGVILYRLSNTLDAMWGYKTSNWLYFGKFSARFDDVLNYIPARLVGLSYACMGNFSQAMKAWNKQAKLCKSPNGGVVMTSGAGALGILLGGPACYSGVWVENPKMGCGRPPENQDILNTIHLINRTIVFWGIGIVLLMSIVNV